MYVKIKIYNFYYSETTKEPKMFDNKLLKKDPLVEAVKQAQADGAMRRQAEALVNEHFGVYSRNAVIRENLAAYDAALEEAYKCMKEGEKWEGSKEDKDEDKKLAKKHGMSMSNWEKSAMDKKHDKQKSMKGLKKGGSASKRADGCATKGKTKGRFV